ncbi:hypothetical protein JHN63_09980 [Streptomyces sp. MBT65]|uniref:hypothetical protein n=1 Tax=Streptomyces sp. MBT65 TaxID=1488395 RepID=UPI00190E1D76|nr:hypothetical protein [Streptomyces sp. MBT65]MBK3574145.1 hypothetical protein [Streptomyces sp. MBT65]
MTVADLAASAPPSAPPSTAGAVLFIVVGVALMCAGIAVVTDYKGFATLLYTKAMSTRRKRNRPPRIYGGPPAGVSNFRMFGCVHILGGGGTVAAGIYLLSR